MFTDLTGSSFPNHIRGSEEAVAAFYDICKSLINSRRSSSRGMHTPEPVPQGICYSTEGKETLAIKQALDFTTPA
ncbi:hypothetical protein AMECASPLE_014879 [Ameca splendens]|uniref:Uncharacterized protein n=1 Tax=Ameca splendens TaxID=208324 RepID=A0ABV0YDN3_9TELE